MLIAKQMYYWNGYRQRDYFLDDKEFGTLCRGTASVSDSDGKCCPSLGRHLAAWVPSGEAESFRNGGSSTQQKTVSRDNLRISVNRDMVSVFWLSSSRSQIRSAVQACLYGRPSRISLNDI